jgi:hypothetical protein
MTEKVLVPSGHGNGRHYHCNEDCEYIGRARNPRWWDREQAEKWHDPCQGPDCYGEEPDQTNATRACPKCGQGIQRLPEHIRACNGGDVL